MSNSDFGSKLLSGAFIIVVGLLVYSSSLNVLETYDVTVDGNWTEYGVLDSNMLTNDDEIYPDQGTTGTWTSFPENFQQTKSIFLRGEADMRDGTGVVRVLSYENPPDTQASPNQTLTRNITSGEFNYVFNGNISEYDYFELEVELTEKANDQNKRPSVSRVSYGFSALGGGGLLDPARPIAQVFGLFIFMLGIIVILTGVWSA